MNSFQVSILVVYCKEYLKGGVKLTCGIDRAKRREAGSEVHREWKPRDR